MKFPVTVMNKKIVVEAENKAMLAEKIDEIVQSEQFKALPEIEAPKQVAGLPALQETEKKIEARPELLGEAGKSIKESAAEPASIKDVFFPIRRVAKPVLQAVGGVAQRAEAAIANPLLATQRGLDREGVPKLATKEEFEEVGGEIVKGVTGERRGEIGDVIRTTGVGKGIPVIGDQVNEALAATTGFLATLGLTNLATKGKLIDSGRKASSALKQARALKVEKRAKFFTSRGTRLKKGVEELLGGVKKEFDELYNRVKGIGGKPISPKEAELAQEFLERQSPATISRYNRTIGSKTGVQLGQKTKGSKVLTQKGKPFIEAGKPVPPKDIAEVKALKDVISNSVSDSVWSGAEKATQAEAIAMGDVDELAKIIANNSGSRKGLLLSLNDKFTRLSKFRTQIFQITQKSKGVPKATTLKNIRKIGQEGELEILTNFSKDFFPETAQILKEIDSFNKFEKIGKFGRAVVSPSNITRLGIIGALRGARKGAGGGDTVIQQGNQFQ